MADQQKRSIQRRGDDLQPSKTMLFWSCAGAVAVALVVGFTWGGWVTGLFWSCAGSVAVALVVDFTWGGWVTGGSAQKMAGAAGDTSRYELASVICVDRSHPMRRRNSRR